jgi:two-component system, NarL family, nitrate/nitrite response regulator NarL
MNTFYLLMSSLVEKTVLIDDSDIDLFIQRRFLEVYEFSNELLLYKSASDALNWLRKLNGERPPDVIFLDLNMPEIDGFAFLRSFNELPETIKHKSRIVVLTSSNSVQDRDMAFQNKNVIQFITKPLKQTDIEQLKNMIGKNSG